MSVHEQFQEINNYYRHAETELKKNLEEIDMKLKLTSFNNSNSHSTNNYLTQIPTLEEAIARNTQLCKALENVKARLRSRAIYNPSEGSWCTIVRRYQEQPSLQVVSWECCANDTLQRE